MDTLTDDREVMLIAILAAIETYKQQAKEPSFVEITGALACVLGYYQQGAAQVIHNFLLPETAGDSQ